MVDGVRDWLSQYLRGGLPIGPHEQQLAYNNWRIQYSRFDLPTANLLCNHFMFEGDTHYVNAWERVMRCADNALWTNICANCDGKAPTGDYLCPTCRTM